MLYFMSDYTEGAHPGVLQRLTELNMVSLPGYGEDEYCEAAKEKIKKFCGRDDLQIQFLTGGTQTNLLVISTMLRRYEAVIAAETGHINVHEAGAIEYSGHKVLTVPSRNGKVAAEDVAELAERFYDDGTHEHMSFPGMVYISHPTEVGTLYTREELRKLSEVCRKYDMPLYMDGARLGYGLMSPESDLSIKDICELCDVFYIGGTKVGALCGEAVVFTHGNMPRGFTTMTKQQGAMLAKGRLLGMQFDALFTDGLYLEIGRRGIETAMKLKKAFIEKGYELYIDSPTNQQFIILSPEQYERLSKIAAFSIWEKIDSSRIAVRFVTSWATSDEALDELISQL